MSDSLIQVTVLTILGSAVALILIAPAIPPAIRDRSWKRFFVAALLSFVGVVLPLFIFLGSMALMPEWKGACRLGWIHCFHVGKIALLPLVLWASAALYALEIYRTPNRTRPWIVLGILTGAITSTTCLGIGVIICGLQWRPLYIWLLVPLYISSWYIVRARELLRQAKTSLEVIKATVFSSIPFWLAAILWSQKSYISLPNGPPSCFIVTAAMQGHETVVGPRMHVIHQGRSREANQQLLTLWLLEDLWKRHASHSHAGFRRFYNIAGPVVASYITSPSRADLAYMVIKPIEMVARAILRKMSSDRYDNLLTFETHDEK
jgi:hypothetical protein